ncbi:MAG TPA: aminodeoxychorismate/anthranilate synthase component II [Ignavibacteriales bacterium]|nr:aminodeoxychorismate/anthranilate synthase component II [Ignavibacteriales bacterium]
MDILLIDCYDSFTFNIFQYLKILGNNVRVIYYDDKKLYDIYGNYHNIIFSPGPGKPEDYNNLYKILDNSLDKKFLGICLGMQIMAVYFGAKVIKSNVPIHGYTSKIIHNSKKIFKGLKNPLNVMRYHSLIVETETLPDSLVISAKTKKDVIMGIEHKVLNFYGVQFHPESYLSEDGMRILKNWCEL